MGVDEQPPDLDARFTQIDALTALAQSTLTANDAEAAIAAVQKLANDLGGRLPAALLNNLASLHLMRYDALGVEARRDLDVAMNFLNWLEANVESGDRLRPFVVGLLARALRTRFDADGNRADVDAAIELLRAVVLSDPPPDLAADMSADLANALRQRWKVAGQENDMVEAARALEDAHRLTLDDEVRGRVLNRLGVLQLEWSNATHDPALLEQAVSTFDASAATYPADSFGRLEALNNLADALRQRFEISHSIADIDRAVKIARELVAVDGQPSADLSERQHNVAVHLLAREAAVPDEAALAEAEGLVALALANPNVGLLSRATFTYTAATLAMRRFATGDEAAAPRAVQALTQVAGSSSSPALALQAARTLGSFEGGRGRWTESALSYRHAVDIAASLFRGLASDGAKRAWLQGMSGLPQAAAFALARAGDVEGAVETLEQARTLILSERLARRSAALDELRSSGLSPLADAYEAALTNWMTSRGDPERARACDDAIDRAIEGIRAVPGFERFLAAPTIADVRSIAANHPVVYLVIGQHGGVALVVSATTTRSVELPAFAAGDDVLWRNVGKYAQAYDRRVDVRAWSQALDELTGWMGAGVMSTVFDQLGGAMKATIIPTGVLVLLPWHASWWSTGDGDERTIFGEEVVVAYAPSAAALLALPPNGPSSMEIAAIEEPQPVRAARLPAARLEVEGVLANFSSPPPLRLPGPSATVSAVLDALEKVPFAHFACHGRATPTDPISSGLLLSGDEPLTIEMLARVPGRAAAGELIVLSACETAVTGTLALDETINVSMAFMALGWRSVVGSLWVAPDQATAILMIRMYWHWQVDQTPLPDALASAQRWLRTSTNGEIADWLTWSRPDNAGHIGLAQRRRERDPNDKPFTAAVYWAGFTFAGRIDDVAQRVSARPPRPPSPRA